ncbi:MAG: DUF1501 domain-containing protein [Bdellovibrionaceae bacterium]|nr:DUF1501 domain-containing protein [Pseudobdellovibrionaceae bacterium]
MLIDRRSFLQYSALGASTYFLPQWSWAQNAIDTHQLLHIHISGAADFTYGFDARPLEMTLEGLLQNYNNVEPDIWTAPVGGKTTLASAQTRALLPLKNDFSIINGVYVDSLFANHPQAENLWFTGSAFGGPTYLPFINGMSLQKKTPLDGLKMGPQFFINTNNMGSHLPFGSTSTTELAEKLKKEKMQSSSPAMQFLQERLRLISSGKGKFSEGAGRMGQALQDSITLSEQITKTNLAIDPHADRDIQFLNLFKEFSQQKSIRTGLIAINGMNPDEEFALSFDTHDATSAKAQPDLFKYLYERIARILTYMKSTEFSSTESLLDVTTVIVTTEFGRTMRQNFVAIDATGTDHNALCTSVLIAGKGILGGKIVGESDFRSSRDILSGAHLKVDPKKMNIMARPFDFAKQEAVKELPEDLNANHYLNVGSVINTLFDVTGVDKSVYRKIGNGAAAKVLPSLTTLIK